MEQSYQRELQKRHNFAKEAAELLGKRALHLFHSRQITMEYKADGSKVTTADIALNDYYIELMAERFPNDLIWGEEGCNMSEGEFGSRGDLEAANDRWMWLLDPIDGTSGFWRAYQSDDTSNCTSAVMITGFAPGATTPTISAVHSPFMRHQSTTIASEHFGVQYYTTRRTEPRTVILSNADRPQTVVEVERFEENYWQGSTPDLRVMADMMPYARKVRTSSIGAAMSRLALGDIDIVAFPGPANPHDVAPGGLIAHKACAVVQTLEGTPYEDVDWRVGPIGGVVVTANPELGRDFLQKLAA